MLTAQGCTVEFSASAPALKSANGRTAEPVGRWVPPDEGTDCSGLRRGYEAT
jgi:hypothetical protein